MQSYQGVFVIWNETANKRHEDCCAAFTHTTGVGEFLAQFQQRTTDKLKFRYILLQ